MCFTKKIFCTGLFFLLLPTTVQGLPQAAELEEEIPAEAEAQSQVPSWFLELLERETAPLKPRPIATADGKLKALVAAELAAEPENHNGDYFLELGIGTDTPMECWIYPEGHDLAAAHRRFSETAFEAIAQVHGKIEDRIIKRIDAGVFGSHPYLALDWLYRVKAAKGGIAAGEIKHLAAVKGESSVYCRHNETGFKKSFQRVFQGLVEHLELADAPTTPFYQEVMVASLTSLPTGVAITSMSRDESGKIKVVERTALLIPVNQQTLVANDSYNIQFSTEDGRLLDEVEVDSVNGGLTSQLRLRAAEEGWKISGTWSGEKLESSIEPKRLLSILGQRLALRKFLARAKVGGKMSFSDWTTDADPKALTEIGIQLLGQGGDNAEVRFDLGPRKMDAILDKNASIQSATTAMGSLNLKFWRVHIEGTLPTPSLTAEPDSGPLFP